jgi:pantoate--beta-alanine ligase
MRVVTTVKELQQILNDKRANNRTIGFVPTMGALHQGHLSLVNTACQQADCVVVSVFVNPTQFNNLDDLERYPRILDKDVELLKSTRCEIVFAPSVEEMYPQEDTRRFDFGMLDKVMEGEHRPGHFNGVGQVVSRLLDITKPQKAFFGLKDFQQLAIVRQLVNMLKIDVEIIACPIVRETDGLAMSSRNMLLTPLHRKNAPSISLSLFESCNFVPKMSVKEVIKFVIDSVNKVDGLEVEYYDIVDGVTLQPVSNWDDSPHIVGCIAVHAGKVRLIDNVIYK